MAKSSAGAGRTAGSMRPTRLGRPTAWLAAALTVAVLAVIALGWLTFVSVPRVEVGVIREPDGSYLVGNVPVGGPVWLAGVRPGWSVVAFAPPEGAPTLDWRSLSVTDGIVRIDLQRELRPPEPTALIAAAASLAIGALRSDTLAIPRDGGRARHRDRRRGRRRGHGPGGRRRHQSGCRPL